MLPALLSTIAIADHGVPDARPHPLLEPIGRVRSDSRRLALPCGNGTPGGAADHTAQQRGTPGEEIRYIAQQRSYPR